MNASRINSPGTIAVLLILIHFAGDLRAEEEPQVDNNVLQVPFAFYNENFGFAAGYSFGKVRFLQPQAAGLATVMAGTNDSAMAFGLLRNLIVPGSDRLFFDAAGSAGTFGEFDAFTDGNPDFPFERAGSNDSSKDNFLSGEGVDILARMRFRYLLPIGSGADHIIAPHRVAEGFLVSGASGGTAWNPLKSGRTYLRLEPFYRYQSFDPPTGNVELITNGINVGLFWDNRDFPLDPSYGNSLSLQWSQDFGWLNSTDDWTNLQLEYDQYFDWGSSSRFHRRVLALNFWSSVSPSWNERPDGSISNRPPPYTGSSLGGLWRMRAFPGGRFNDKAAIYYAGELRMTARSNPFDRWQWLQERVRVEWIQLVPFVEVGRVAPSWDFSELHEDMKLSAGLGLRFWAKGFVLRVDTAFSDEDIGVQMMIGHPFQF